MDVLLLGPARAGKSVLLARIEACCAEPSRDRKRRLSASKRPGPAPTRAPVLHPGPTDGVERKALAFQGCNLVVREVGYSLRESWSDFFGVCGVLVFVVDASDRQQVPAAAVWLLRVLRSKEMKEKPIIVVFNKQDLPGIMTRTELALLLQLDALAKGWGGCFSVVEVSAGKGSGVDGLVEVIVKALKKRRNEFKSS